MPSAFGGDTGSGSADGAPTPPPDGDAMEVEKVGHFVTARDLSRRLKNLLNNLPLPLPPDPKREAAVGGAKADMEEEAAEVAEVFVLSLYPSGIDRNKPAEPMTLDGGGGAVAVGAVESASPTAAAPTRRR